MKKSIFLAKSRAIGRDFLKGMIPIYFNNIVYSILFSIILYMISSIMDGSSIPLWGIGLVLLLFYRKNRLEVNNLVDEFKPRVKELYRECGYSEKEINDILGLK